METIEFKNVSFTYPNCTTVALNDVSFAINESEFVVVCGESGSGKTTLLRHMKKNMVPYGRGTGDILYMGQNIENLEDRISASEIGYVQQNPDNQIVTDKVWHELAFGLESLGESNLVIRKKTAEMAEYFGVSNWFRKNVWELSGGQKQLLNLASVMIMQPKVLILDEPTAQLDPIAATQFFDTIRKINQDFGTTIILSEHRLEEVFSMADKVLAMDKGKIVVFDTPEKVGKVLTNNNKSLFYGLPSAMKIYAEVTSENNTNFKIQELANEKCPITVKEGRLWLDSFKKTAQCEQLKNRRSEDKLVDNTLFENEISSTISGIAKSNITAIDLKNVYFRYEKKNEDILSGLNLTVKKGEMLAILGGNGVGKTTLLKLITGIKKPYAGKVKSDGRVIALPQNAQAIFTEITVEEELGEAFTDKTSYNNSITKEDIISSIDDMIAFMELENYRKTNPYDLSGGQQQKLAIAKVLLLQPQILLLDEPTKGIDPYFKRSLAKILEALIDKGVTIVMVSHDIEFCAQYASRCAMLFDGTIVSEGATRDFFGGNSFYTTAANRISRHLFKNCVTCEQVVEACRNIGV
ncbi:ABC transporter ATP-binding protein [[Clostridium] fimetarium]|uniref:Energy-coupling factor transport system ATP-binding protein n=1 Tax=[Clostridium] fimetarium TaxID=99656 RepID=A0A1I0QSD2_9FIRM|nr:ABC transporter ATP-binding protein [[Clostridium] fimetarium]SEW30212.1 energy-coupling factor transport system ATP-binding protein [[Clostridium] fimetarium]